jgi:N6-adenosine-specific RNA methylase IME4
MQKKMKFDVILADPPWHFKTWSDKGRGRSPKYPTMKFQDIVGLGDLMRQISADNCALFLWVTMPFLEKCFEVISAWGFDYRTCAFTWGKMNKKEISWFQGTGYYTRANAELCLLGIKGKMPVEPKARPPSLIMAPVLEHSRKPHAVVADIHFMYPDTKRLEMFASKHSKDFASQYDFTPIGFDVDGLDIRESLQKLIDL